MRKPMLIAAIGTLTVVVGLGGLWSLQRRLIYFPEQQLPSQGIVAPEAEAVEFTTDDGLTLNGWFFAHPQADAAVVVFNGNGGNRGGRVGLARSLASLEHGVLLFDYRGYGGNQGQPSEEGLIADGLAAVRFVGGRPDVDPTKIIYFGESLGAAVALGVAEQIEPAALVLRSPFASLASVGSIHYPILPMSMLLRDRYDNVERIGRIAAPLLIVAGSADGTIPIDESRHLYDAAAEPKELVVIEGADHNDYELAGGPQLIEAVGEFLAEHGP
ncbi:MAG: alpha/beta hydrolase [Actinomycetota bacterium]